MLWFRSSSSREAFQGISATSNYRIDEKAESLNNIFRVTIGIAPLSNYNDSSVNGKSATAMNGKSFTIGSVGFTYRQGTSAYGAGVQTEPATSHSTIMHRLSLSLQCSLKTR